ncbi:MULTISPECIES: outer membrane beta-barrel protein [unclassified Leptolyngbya]|uniref:outer membrane beta-barrel protein n=1 Tax=unclassified Leptolyngbya TaxID=2650499 RepID=UPI0016838988|nr:MULTISPECIES: outer membrane beta-barrel protein [unclassified Leptolyngbya]MBD1910333.1 outer membrane beta-barrel protein [Leptolyngbya sp. FACHB-8]MBD2154864.1 outer membrane beta-barrel protein [Leptolyngbya sp. FACHB-16]
MMEKRWLWFLVGLGFGVVGLGEQAAIAQTQGQTQPQIRTQTHGLEGSYLGATVDGSNMRESLGSLLGTGSSRAWVEDQVEGSRNSSGHTGQRNLQTRIDVQGFPVSIRGAVVLGDDIEAVMPMLSYDVPVGSSANVYAGAGYALVQPGAQTVLGDRDGVVLSTGVEAAINRSVVVYGDVRYHPTSSQEMNPVRVQLGLGHRF